MGAALTWLGAFLAPFAPTLAAWITPKAPVPDPPAAKPPTVDDGDPAARAAAKHRAAEG